MLRRQVAPLPERPGPERPAYERLAWYLDEAFTGPGARIRFGWDAILGLVPGVGDLVTGIVQVLLVVHVTRQRAVPPSLLRRLLTNVALDNTLGAIPVLGDLFDVLLKASSRNVRLVWKAEAELAATGRVSGTRHTAYLERLTELLPTEVSRRARQRREWDAGQRVAVVAAIFLSAVGCARARTKPGLRAGTETYRPGSRVSVDRYLELGERFHDAYVERRPDAEAKLDDLLAYTEPEALAAMLALLEAKDTRTLYGSFSNEPEADDGEIHSFDGLAGFRVVWQRDWVDEKTGEPRLVSAIGSYRYDRETFRFVPRLAADTFRIRVKAARCFHPAGETGGPRGFVGFSWMTEKHPSPILSTRGAFTVKAARYDSHRRSVTDTGRPHPGMAFPGITPCGFAHHRAACHHATRRNFFSSTAASRRPETVTGARELPAHAREELRLTGDELRRLRAMLATPEKTFPRQPVLDAFAARRAARQER